MNQWIMDGLNYPYVFFNEKAFSRQEVLNLTYELYEEVHKRQRRPVHAVGTLSACGLPLYELGYIGNICKGNEGCDDKAYYIRELYDACDQDLFKTRDEYFNERMFVLDEKQMNLMKEDIAKALLTQRVFYINSDVEELEWFYSQDFRAYRGPHPHSEKGLDKYFSNIPVGRVW